MTSYRIHPGAEIALDALVDTEAAVGDRTRIWSFATVLDGAEVGERCNIAGGCFIETGGVVGDRCTLKNNVSIWNGVTLESDVFVGPSAVFTNVHNPRAHVSRKNKFAKTVVRRGATIGANATVISPCEIGEYALVGAGAVVTRDVPAHQVVVGNPARRVCWACTCGEVLRPTLGISPYTNQREYECLRCGLLYSPPLWHKTRPKGGDKNSG